MKPSANIVEIDLSNPLSDGLVGFYMQGEQVYDVVTQSIIPKTGSAGEVSTSEGVATQYNGATYFTPPAPTDEFNVTTVTLTVIAADWKTTGRPIHEPIIGKGDNQYALKGASGALEFFTYRPTTYFDVSYAPTEGQTFIASGTADNNFLRLYVDGAEVDNQPDTGAGLIATSALPLELGRNSQNTGRLCGDQKIVLTCIHDRVLTPAEVASLHSDPYQVLKTKTSTVYEFSEPNGTQISDITGGALAGGGLGGALSDLQTNGSGAALNVNDFTTVGIYKGDAQNRSIVEIPSSYTGGTTSYVAPLIACDGSNEGYKPLLVLDTGTTYNRVQFSKDGTFLSSPFLTTPLDVSLGDCALDLSISGTTLTCDIYQNGALHESVSVTDGTPLAREGAGLQFAYQGSQEQALSWSVNLPVGGLVQGVEVPAGLSAVGTFASPPTAGNLLLFVANNGLSFASVTTPPAGFNLLTSYDGNWKNFWYYKISDGTETTAQLDWSHAGGYGHYIELYWQKGVPASVQTVEDETNVGASNPGPQTTGSLTPDAATNLLIGQVTASTANLANQGQVWTGLSSVAAIPDQSNPGTSVAVAADQSGATSGSLDWTDGSPGSYGALAAFNYSDIRILNVQSVENQFSAATTLNYTLPANADRLVIAHYADYGPSSRNILGATWDGNAATQIQIADDDGTEGRIVSAFIYDVSAMGAVTADAVVNLDTAGAAHLICFCLESDGDINYRTPSAGLNGSAASVSNSVTSELGDLVLSFVGWDGQTDAATGKDSGQATIGVVDQSRGLLGVYSQLATGTTTLSDFSVAGADSYGSFGVAFYVAAAGGTLAADLAASGTISADLTTPATTLAADLVAAGTLGANLTLPADTLQADLSASGAVTADLTIPADTLASDLVAAGTLGANLTLPADTLQADLSASGAVTADLTIPADPLAADLIASGTITAALTIPTDTFAADLVATGTLGANLTLPADTLQADLSASGTITADLTLGDTLSADLSGTGTLVAALTVPADTLAAGLSASGTLGALLTLPTDTLAADLSASGTITANLTLPADLLAADLSASGTLTARLTIPVLVSGWEIELQGALYGVLSGATDISDLGAQVYDDVPEQDSTFPYVTIGEALHNEWDTDTELGIDATVTIHVWSRYRGRKETKQLQDAIYRALHRAQFAVGNYNLVTCDFNSSETLVETDGKTRHGVQVFRVLLDDAA